MFLTKELARQKVSDSGKEKKDGGELRKWQPRKLRRKRPQRKRRSNNFRRT
jgi:hypothetical protein